MRWLTGVVATAVVAGACSTPDLPDVDTSEYRSPYAPELAARIVVDVAVDGDGRVEMSPSNARPGVPFTLEPVAADGQRFAGWSGDATGSVTPLELVSESDLSITATFEPIPDEYELDITVEGEGWVSRASGPAAEGNITVVANPAAGQEFVGWRGDLFGDERSLDLTVNRDITLTATFAPSDGPGPAINVWNGDDLRFSAGNVQRWVNILGNVSDADGISDVYYILNGAQNSLSLGPDERRLENPGDFNIELDTSRLIPGETNVEIVAVDTTGAEARRIVSVDYQTTRWPLPYRTDWSAAGTLADQGQVVDGAWILTEEGVRTQEPGYDRLIAFGDNTWTDYEISTRFRIHSIDASGFGGVSNRPLVGMVLRWPGHSANDDSQPRWGFWPAGSIGGYKIDPDGSFLSVDGNFNSESSVVPDVELELDREYELIGSVTSGPRGAEHRITIREVGVDDPDVWSASVLIDGQPSTGAAVLVAHRVDVTFSDVTIRGL